MLDFLHQGGYAFYVWSAFGMTFVLLVAEVVSLRRSRRTILRRVGRLARLRAQNEPSSQPSPRPSPQPTEFQR
ncbi:MAG: heme exporter protein CcmD [Thiohalocapsa sp.]|nr:heme exporter protein CcmD [Thiohalocapsa sp.]MCG6940534.1 heme exporter protein CcmD [Thiohalocapsa sp.]